jgi:hypothetical protein
VRVLSHQELLNFTLPPRFWNGLAGILLCCLVVPAARGIPLTYVFSGPASGTLGATAFTGAQVTVTGTADTANVSTLGAVPADPCINLTSLTINIAGLGSATAITPSVFIDSPALSAWGILSGSCPGPAINWVVESNPLAATYGIITALGPATGTQLAGGSLPTTAGTLTFTAVPLTFQATLSTVFTADQSDLWYILAESGWGMQLVQRGTIIFATLFVYGPSGTPTWYVATMDYTTNLTWTGDLYATTGPYFATVPFNPANVIPTKVGTMTWAPQNVANGTLTYVVNGTTVVKNVTRETLVNEDYSGHYAGGLHDVVTGCPNAAANGTFDRGAVIDIMQSGTAITIQNVDANGVTCNSAGTLNQAGQMGAIPGAPFVCTDGSTGVISFDELQVNRSSVSGTFSVTYSVPLGCQASGWLGGYRGTTF